MKNHLLNLILFNALLSTCSAFSMQPLGKIEKYIIGRNIYGTNKKYILRIIKSTDLHTITTLVNPQAKDPFSQLVMQEINKNNQISFSVGNYTQCHQRKDDFNNLYIELVSTFKKDSLLKILNKE